MNYKASLGLLASMALRYDHAFGMDAGQSQQMPWPELADCMGYTPERRVKLLREMLAAYSHITAGAPATDIYPVSLEQITEEVNGAGFYSPEYNDYYIGLLKLTQHELLQLESDLGVDRCS